MAKVSSKDKIKQNIGAQSDGVQSYFSMLDELLDNVSRPEPALAYCFQRIETAQRVGLYCLLMREYRTDSGLAWDAVDRLDITRANFPEYYKAISGRKLPNGLKATIAPAEEVRDHITHGRSKSAAEINGAILKCLQYVEALNNAFYSQAGFRPVGDLRGVTSKKGKPQLDKKITRVVLKGLGFAT